MARPRSTNTGIRGRVLSTSKRTSTSPASRLASTCPLAHDLRTAATLCLLAAAWAALPVRALWFMRCHRQIPLSPSGLRADLDAVRQGSVHGIPCLKMYWPLMFACGITGHDLIVMTGGTVLAVAEKRMFRLKRKPLVYGCFALAAWILARWVLFGTNDE
jgi:hypothetical protein